MTIKVNSLFPVGNAAGWCKSVEEVERLSKSACECIVVGSITLEERLGNPGNTFNNESLNSIGLKNPGIEKILAMSDEMVKFAHDANKPIILSIAGFSIEDYRLLSKKAASTDFDGVEVNFGCPNVADEGKRKPIFSFDLDLMDNALDEVILNFSKFISVKVSPMSNPMQIVETAGLLSVFGIDAVVTQNTFPNGLLYNPNGTPQIETPDKTGWAGFAGSAIKPMALGQVNQWRKALDSFDSNHIPVWGVGGVKNGQDVHDMIRAGASLVQVGTAYFVGGPKIFSDIANEYLA